MSTTTPRARYGAYHRVSQESGRDRDDALTVEDAWRQIDAWGAMRHIDVSERYLDWDHTGSKMQRPELDRLLADLDAGAIDGVVVAQVDRFSRADVGDALKVVKQITGPNDRKPRPLVLLDLGIDPSTEFGEFGLTILLGLARMQWRRYQRQWRTARGRAAGRNVSLSLPPIGYLRVCSACATEVRPGNRRDRAVCPSCNRVGTGILALDPVMGPVITELFRRRAAAHSWSALCDWLNDELELRSRRGNRFSHPVVMGIVRNRAYLGESPGAYKVDGPKLDTHPALVDAPIWHAAQQDRRMAEDRGGYPTVAQGLIRCASCRYTMAPRRTSEARVVYRCRRELQAHDCPDPSSIVAIATNGSYKLDEYLVEEFFAHQHEIGFQAVDIDLQTLGDELQDARDELKQTQDNTKLYRDMGPVAFGELVAQLRRELEETEAEWEEANATAGGGLGMTVAALREAWPTLPLDVQRRHLAKAIQCVFVRPVPEETRNLAYVKTDPERTRRYYSSRVRVVWAGDDPVRTPRRGDGSYVITPFTDFVAS